MAAFFSLVFLLFSSCLNTTQKNALCLGSVSVTQALCNLGMFACVKLQFSMLAAIPGLNGSEGQCQGTVFLLSKTNSFCNLTTGN